MGGILQFTFWFDAAVCSGSCTIFWTNRGQGKGGGGGIIEQGAARGKEG